VWGQVIPSDVGSNLPWNFVFKSSFWSKWSFGRPTPKSKAGNVPCGWEDEVPGSHGPAVTIRDLRKVFKTTDGGLKAAVDGLQLDVERGEITALLGNPLRSAREPVTYFD